MGHPRVLSWLAATLVAAGITVGSFVPALSGEAQTGTALEHLRGAMSASPAGQHMASNPAEDPLSWSSTVIAPETIPATTLDEISLLKTRLSRADHVAALQALHYALTEIGDGATFVWHRKEGLISGMVKPTSSFVNANGAVCRHIIYKLTIQNYSKQIEGDACRSADARRWQIAG